MSDVRLYQGDCLQVMATLAPNSIDSIVTDPPYGLSFMGKNWDHGVPGVPFWEAALRVAKPGAMMLAFGSTRTHHRLMCAIEDAGWEIRDCLMWLYGSGFNKHRFALKPAWEPIIMARKPLSEANIDANIARWGVAGLNIADCRIASVTEKDRQAVAHSTHGPVAGKYEGWGMKRNFEPVEYHPQGRWPANVLLDEDAAALLDEMTISANARCARGDSAGVWRSSPPSGIYGKTLQACPPDRNGEPIGYGNGAPGASRFFFRVAHEPLCALCSCPKSESHGIMTATEDIIPCAKSANNAGTNSSQSITTTSNGSVATNALDSGKQSNGATAEQSSAPASNAAKSTKALQVNGSTSALTSAEESRSAQIAQSVKSAGNLCDLCATSIAQSIVAMQQGQSPESILGQAFMPERKRQILTKCLASFVALLGNTDTIPTMDSLNLLFGSVRDAMQNSTQIGAMADVAAQTSRLQYCSKASKRDRDEGLEGMPERPAGALKSGDGSFSNEESRGRQPRHDTQHMARNVHPTVKPTQLMRYLVRLVTPPNGTVLDPFLGSGSTLKAAKLEGFNGIGIEIDAEYLEIAQRRIDAAQPEHRMQLPLLEAAG